MRELFERLKGDFQDEDFRYAYAESFLNTKLAAQIKTLREQRGMTQAQVAAEMGIKQPGYRRFEDVNHAVWKTDSLWNIARALGVRVDIGFKTFGTLIEEKSRLTKESLRLPGFEDDPFFKGVDAVATYDMESAGGFGCGSSPRELLDVIIEETARQSDRFLESNGISFAGASATLLDTINANHEPAQATGVSLPSVTDTIVFAKPITPNLLLAA